MSGSARTDRTGTSKLVNDPGHAMHVVLRGSSYSIFQRWCHEHNTTPTQKTRELVEEFTASLIKPIADKER